MADNLSNDAEQAILDHIHGVADLSITLPLKLALYTTVPSDSIAGSEVTGGSYVRQTITMGASDSSSVSANTNTVTFLSMPACTVVGMAIYETGGMRIWHGPTSANRTLADGDDFEVGIGELTVSLG